MSFKRTLTQSYHDCRALIFSAASLLALFGGAGFYAGGRLSDLTFILPSLALSVAFVLGAFTVVFLGLYPAAAWREWRSGTFSMAACRKRVDEAAARYFDSGRFTEGLPPFLAILLMIFIIPFMKSLIPVLHSYGLDPLLEQWDTWLHAGHHPQDLLAPLVEKAGAVPLLNVTYNLWFPVMLGAYWYAAFLDGDRNRRMRFLWASLAGWVVIGGALATLASSVGPIFYGDFYSGVNPYAAYKSHLDFVNETHPLISLWVAEILLGMARDERVINANAISAMPSMHLAVAAFVTLYAYECRKAAGLLAALFLVLILSGSIYLGWHYAIDGYAGIAAAVLIYAATKCAQGRFGR